MKSVVLMAEFHFEVAADIDVDDLCLGLHTPVQIVTLAGEPVAECFVFATIDVAEAAD